MENLMDFARHSFLLAAKQTPGNELEQLWQFLQSLLPFAIIIVFWLLSRALQRRTSNSPETTQKSPSLGDLFSMNTGTNKPNQVAGRDNVVADDFGFASPGQPGPGVGPPKTIPGAPIVNSKPIRPRWWGA